MNINIILLRLELATIKSFENQYKPKEIEKPEKLTVKEIYKKIESLENFERQIDQLVYKLYNLTSEEIKIAKESKK